jgi:hypothetical protein
MKKCLMIETKDKRKFFTYAKNQKELKEFTKNFNAKMFLVKAEIKQNNILDLEKLAPAICDKSYNINISNFEIIK